MMKTLLCAVLSGVVLQTTCNFSGPNTRQPLRALAGEDQTVEPQQEVTLTGAASGGVTDHHFRWNWERGPEAVEIDNPASASITLPPFTVEGTYIFRLLVIDGAGRSATDFVSVIVMAAPGSLAVTINAPSTAALAEPLELSAEVVNAAGAITYAWSVTAGDANFDDSSSPTPTLTPNAEGRLEVRLEVTDADTAQRAIDEATIDVSAAPLMLTVDAPAAAQRRQPFTASVSVAQPHGNLAYRWAVVSGMANLTGTFEAVARIDPAAVGTLVVRVTVTDVGNDRMANETVSIEVTEEPVPMGTNVRFAMQIGDQSAGDILIRMFTEEAPITTENFLQYVDDDFYDDSIFHRVIPDFVIQGGSFRRDDSGQLQQLTGRPPISNESSNGLSNVRGTLSMALLPGQPDSGTSGFFINLVDNARLDADGHTVFGEVIQGMDIVDQIAALETQAEGAAGTDVPVMDATVVMAVREEGASGELSVRIEGPASMTVGLAGSFAAIPSGVLGAASFNWEIVSGTAQISDPASSSPEIVATAAGNVEIRVTVTDSQTSQTAQDSVTVPVTGENEPLAVQLVAPSNVQVGTPTPLSAIVNGASGGTTLLWEVLSGDASFDNPASIAPNITANAAGEVQIRVTVTDSGTGNSAQDTVTLTVTPPSAPFFVNIEGLTTLSVNEESPYTAVPINATGNVTFQWNIDSGVATLSAFTGSLTTLIPMSPGIVVLTVTATDEGTGEIDTFTLMIEVS